MPKSLKASSRKCSSCGDDMLFNPEKFALFCPSCHKESKIAAKKIYAKHDVNENVNRGI